MLNISIRCSPFSLTPSTPHFPTNSETSLFPTLPFKSPKNIGLLSLSVSLRQSLESFQSFLISYLPSQSSQVHAHLHRSMHTPLRPFKLTLLSKTSFIPVPLIVLKIYGKSAMEINLHTFTGHDFIIFHFLFSPFIDDSLFRFCIISFSSPLVSL